MSTGHAILARFQPDELKDIDEWRRSQQNPPTRGGALKKLVGIALRSADLQHKDQRRRASASGN
jgi:hypothetical protein